MPMSLDCPIAANACHSGSVTKLGSLCNIERTWMRGKCFGLLSRSILRRPTPMAPEDTMTTLCPSLRNWTAVSTISDKVERSGSCVFSSTIELVPARRQSEIRWFMVGLNNTKLDDDSEGLRTLHDGRRRAAEIFRVYLPTPVCVFGHIRHFGRSS